MNPMFLSPDTDETVDMDEASKQEVVEEAEIDDDGDDVDDDIEDDDEVEEVEDETEKTLDE